MSTWNLIQIQSAQELRSEATRWDDLWRRSEVTLPTVRAELTAQWLEHFASDQEFVCLVVEHEGRFVAALPLVRSHGKGIVPMLKLTSNPWATCGELLLDPSCDTPTALRALVEGLRNQPAAIVFLEGVEFKSPRWRAFQTALVVAELKGQKQVEYIAGRAVTSGSWEDYQKAWSRNHRRSLSRSTRQLKEIGTVSNTILEEINPDDVDELLQQVFEVEHRSWKGPQGTSVLATPGMLEFYQRQARELAAHGELQVSLLECDGWPVASEMAYFSRGVLYAHKIGYDEAYAQCSPGLLLMRAQFEHYYHKENRRLVDFMGVLSQNTARWSTNSYEVGRLVTSTGGLAGDSLFRAFKCARRAWRFLRGRPEEMDTPEPPKLGSAKMLESLAPESSSPALVPANAGNK